MNPLHHTQYIHQTHLKVLADLLHHLQLSFIGWKLKGRAPPLITLANDTFSLFMAIPMCSARTLRSYQFYFQRPDWSRGTSRNTLTHSNTHTQALSHITRTLDWTKAYRSHHIAHAKHMCLHETEIIFWHQTEKVSMSCICTGEMYSLNFQLQNMQMQAITTLLEDYILFSSSCSLVLVLTNYELKRHSHLAKILKYLWTYECWCQWALQRTAGTSSWVWSGRPQWDWEQAQRPWLQPGQTVQLRGNALKAGRQQPARVSVWSRLHCRDEKGEMT